MTDYGFNEDDSTPPPLKKTKSTLKQLDVESAVAEGEQLGFVARPMGSRSHKRSRRNGRRQVEPQGKLLVTGPERVLDQLREIAAKDGVPYWVVIEDLLDKS